VGDRSWGVISPLLFGTKCSARIQPTIHFFFVKTCSAQLGKFLFLFQSPTGKKARRSTSSQEKEKNNPQNTGERHALPKPIVGKTFSTKKRDKSSYGEKGMTIN
jgi:hypothetical protein